MQLNSIQLAIATCFDLTKKRTRHDAWTSCDFIHQGWPTCLRLGSTRKFLANSQL